MRLKASFLYQILDLRWAFLIYYIVILFLAIFADITIVGFSSVSSEGVVEEGNTMVMSGITGASAVFIFIVGLNSFTENFRFGLQNGVSRKTIFLSRMCTAVASALFMAVVDQIIHTLISLFHALQPNSHRLSVSLFQQLYPAACENPVQGFFLSVVFSFCLLLFISNVGYAIVMLFYRVGKLGKVLVGAGIPVALIFGIPAIKALDTLYFGERLRAFSNAVISPVLDFAFNTVPNCMISLLLLAALFALIDWLLLRRAIVR